MSFDLDKDLTDDFNEIVSGKKGKKKVKDPTDFEFSEKNAATLDLGFDESIGKDPIEEGGKRFSGIGSGKKSGKKKKEDSDNIGDFF